MLKARAKIALVAMEVLVVGSALVLGCSKGSDTGISDNAPVVDPVAPIEPDTVTPVVSTCDACFKAIPVNELCAEIEGGYSYEATVLEQTQSYVEIGVRDNETEYGRFTGTLVPYDPAKDVEYQVIRSTEYTYNHMTRTYVMEFRYRNIQIGCNSVLLAGNTYEGILSVLKTNVS